MQRHFPSFERVGSGTKITRQISTPNVSNVGQPYFIHNHKKELRRKEALNEPAADYDNSEGEDVFDTRMDRRASGKLKRGKFVELFVATPAAADAVRRQGSERLMFARPL